VLDDLHDGSAAMVMKLHHSISDGVGLVQMTSSLVERYRDRDPGRGQKPMPPAPRPRVMTRTQRVWDALAHEGAQRIERNAAHDRRGLEGLGGAVFHPLETARRLSEGIASTAVSWRPSRRR
jgi:hypothetical protein